MYPTSLNFHAPLTGKGPHARRLSVTPSSHSISRHYRGASTDCKRKIIRLEPDITRHKSGRESQLSWTKLPSLTDPKSVKDGARPPDRPVGPVTTPRPNLLHPVRRVINNNDGLCPHVFPMLNVCIPVFSPSGVPHRLPCCHTFRTTHNARNTPAATAIWKTICVMSLVFRSHWVLSIFRGTTIVSPGSSRWFMKPPVDH
jgi:hypothetical protein